MRDFSWEGTPSGSSETIDLRLIRHPDGTVEARDLKSDRTSTYGSHEECAQAFSDMLDQGE